MHPPQSHQFKQNATKALHDNDLQKAMSKAKTGFIHKRADAINALPEFEALRQRAKSIKDHTLQYLDFYLETFETQAKAQGAQVHWAETPDQACNTIIQICKNAQAKRITKGKTMAGEEVNLNHALEQAGFEVIETDLGEYIIQLAQEPPSHIIAPAVHKTREQITHLFHTHHQQYGLTQPQTAVPALVNEARQVLRDKFLSADVGITGANFLIAATGTTAIVTNEGNGDLTSSLPRVHIVIAGIEKIVPTLEDTTTLLRLLARSATGQTISTYTSFFTGKKRPTDTTGPEEFHIILLDNQRTTLLADQFREMLRCIRCGACLNHCAVYNAIGGHAYGWVYPGPMGAILTPLMIGLPQTTDLPNACTLNGRCQQVCPMSIPLPSLLRQLRVKQYQAQLNDTQTRWTLALWAFLATRPRLYRTLTGIIINILNLMGKKKGYFSWLPLAGQWTKERELPAPQGKTFMAQWQAQQTKNHKQPSS